MKAVVIAFCVILAIAYSLAGKSSFHGNYFSKQLLAELFLIEAHSVPQYAGQVLGFRHIGRRIH